MIVDASFEVNNGLLGTMRDVLLHLCFVIENKSTLDGRKKDACIRAIFGVCQKHIEWKRNKYFVNGRIQFIYPKTALRPNPTGGCIISRTSIGEKCDFSTDSPHTVFLDTVIREGVFRWTVRIKYGMSKAEDSGFYLGAVPVSLIDRCHEDVLGSAYSLGVGTCCLVFWRGEKKWRLFAHLRGVEGEESLPRRGSDVPDDSLVVLEIDAYACTIFFIVNGKRFPYGISEVPIPTCLGMSACYQPSSFTSVSFARLPAPTPVLMASSTSSSPLSPALYKCRTSVPPSDIDFPTMMPMFFSFASRLVK